MNEKQFHETITVLIKGSDSLEEYMAICTIVFANMPDNHREFYYKSYHAMKSAADLLHNNGLSGTEFTEAIELIAKTLEGKDKPQPDGGISDNVTPIKH